MKMIIRSLRSPGDIKNERLVFKVDADIEIGNYVIVASKSVDGKVSTAIKFPYWFADKAIKSGDLVVLYSKGGEEQEKLNPSGATTHFFYWGLDAAVWKDVLYIPVLMQVDHWSSYIRPPTVPE